MKYFIGVDAGGTKTEATVYNMDGDILGSAFSGFGNLLINFDEAMANLGKAIDDSSEGLNKEDCLGIYLGVAGIESGNLQQVVTEQLESKYNTYIQAMNDAFIAHAALLHGDPGVLTISGTGSISLAMKDGDGRTAGGWGHLLGDEGSGYWISIEAFKKMILDEDNNLEPSSLSKKMLKLIEGEKVSDIIEFIYGQPKAQIAKFVPLVVEEANEGNEFAISLLQRAGEELALATIRAAAKLEMTSGIKIGLRGSVLINAVLVQEAFVKKINEHISNATFVTEDVSSTKGAYYLGKNKLAN